MSAAGEGEGDRILMIKGVRLRRDTDRYQERVRIA